VGGSVSWIVFLDILEGSCKCGLSWADQTYIRQGISLRRIPAVVGEALRSYRRSLRLRCNIYSTAKSDHSPDDTTVVVQHLPKGVGFLAYAVHDVSFNKFTDHITFLVQQLAALVDFQTIENA
jgi:hypothetical protein